MRFCVSVKELKAAIRDLGDDHEISVDIDDREHVLTVRPVFKTEQEAREWDARRKMS